MVKYILKTKTLGDTTMKVISLINQKGGVGKTTSAIALASYLSKKSKVLLVDMDFQGNATTNCNVDEMGLQYTVKDLLLNDTLQADKCSIVTEKGFDLIGSNLEVADTEINLYSKFSREFILKEKLEGLNYDYIIVDCSPNLSMMTINALMATDLVLVPLEPHIFAIKGISALMNTLNLVKRANKNLKHKFFITKFDARLNSFKELESELRHSLKEDMLHTKIRIDNAVRTSQNEYKTIFEMKNSKCIEDYEQLGEEVINCLKN